MIGSMQPHQLRISDILAHAARGHPTRAIVSRLDGEPDWRGDYALFARRTAQAAHALSSLGVGAGDVVSTLAWNHVRHLELFYAVPGMGAVLATANPRLSDEQIAYTINHAGSRWLLFDRNLLDLVERLADRLVNIDHYVMLVPPEQHGPNAVGALCYEELRADRPTTFDWIAGDENDGAILCYTSGTTGDPKGVLYSHRSIVLHAMATSVSGAFGITPFDVVMPCSSLYHATAWGLPFVTLMQGAKLVLPGDRITPPNLHALIREEEVTFSAGVPTIWTAYLDHAERLGEDTGRLSRVLIGGAAVPPSLAAKMRRNGVGVIQAWGMTEMSPVGLVSTPTPHASAALGDDLDDYVCSRQGRALFGVEVEIFDEDGGRVDHDGTTVGHVRARGPWVTARYHRVDEPATDENGWLDTGDIGTIDACGYLRLTDRAKDVIKSGGEWISSIDVENVAAGCPGVRLAAVVGAPHPRWDERPVLVVERADGAALDEDDLRRHLGERLVKWWLPDAIVFDAIPLTSTGKADKKLIRQRYATIFQAPR